MSADIEVVIFQGFKLVETEMTESLQLILNQKNGIDLFQAFPSKCIYVGVKLFARTIDNIEYSGDFVEDITLTEEQKNTLSLLLQLPQLQGNLYGQFVICYPIY